MERSYHYKAAYEEAKKELAELVVTREQTERRIILLRMTMESYRSLSRDAWQEDLELSPEEHYLREQSSIGDELRLLLRCNYPVFQNPKTLTEELKRLGRDLSRYDNPQSMVQTILSRMVGSGEAEEAKGQSRKAYRIVPASAARSEI